MPFTTALHTHTYARTHAHMHGTHTQTHTYKLIYKLTQTNTDTHAYKVLYLRFLYIKYPSIVNINVSVTTAAKIDTTIAK